MRVLPKEGHLHLDGFMVVLDDLIITSDNAGMFFGTKTTKVINFRTLERLLRRPGGDMAPIQNLLAIYAEYADTGAHQNNA